MAHMTVLKSRVPTVMMVLAVFQRLAAFVLQQYANKVKVASNVESAATPRVTYVGQSFALPGQRRTPWAISLTVL